MSLFDKQAVITTGRIALMILFSASLANLLSDPELDISELIQLAGDLDEKCSVKGNIFYITDNNDNCIKDIYTLKDFSIKYIDHVNKLIYDNTNNFSVLKQNICNVFN